MRYEIIPTIKDSISTSEVWRILSELHQYFAVCLGYLLLIRNTDYGQRGLVPERLKVLDDVCQIWARTFDL